MNNKHTQQNTLIKSSQHNYPTTPKSTFTHLPKNEFNRECPFHKSLSPLQNNTHKIDNECPGGSLCENFKKIKELEFQIKKMKSTISDLTKLNNYFIFTISQKDEMYRNLLKENTSMKNRYHLFDSQVNKAAQNVDKANTMSDGFYKGKSLKPIQHKGNKGGMIRSSSMVYSNTKRITYYDSERNNNTNTHKQTTQKDNNENHYMKLQEISNKNNETKLQSNSVVSFLSLPNTKLDDIANNENIMFLTQLTQSNEIFISKVKSSSNQFLLNVFDAVSCLMKDYELAIKLIQRLKTFMNGSVALIRSVLSSTSTQVILTNTCDILECERTNLFLYETLSDQLVVFSGDASYEGSLKVSKDEGIVGNVFTKKEKLKIDDAYQDPRFNPEIDKKTNFKTRNMLCHPLIDEHGHSFGAIQAVNKKKRHFNQDDEELMNLFTKQISALLIYIKNHKDNALMISRLKNVFHFTTTTQHVKGVERFTKHCEEMLRKIFLSSVSQVLFVDEEGMLMHYVDEKEIQINMKLLSIVNYVMKRKEMFACANVNKCAFYNTIVDVHSNDGLITFPIMYSGICVGIVQMNVNCELNETTNLPKEDILCLINMIHESIEMWIRRNKEVFPFFKLVKHEIKSFSFTKEISSVSGEDKDEDGDEKENEDEGDEHDNNNDNDDDNARG